MSYKSADFYLTQFAQYAPDVEPVAGHSGYFSHPERSLDPALFDGMRLRPEIAAAIRKPIYVFWLLKYKNPHAWSRLWLAGSGISYQWAADRGNGDLDVMVGIDPVKFRQDNLVYSGLSDAELATHINSELKAFLWPQTAATELGGRTFEVTYYWNPGVGDQPGDIKAINPYAAYDLMSLEWTILPPRLPADPRTLYPKEWWEAVDREAAQARTIITRYNNARDRLARMTPGSPGEINARTELRLAASQAAALFDDIHLGRKAAFGEGGKGYGDYNNFRWQAAKYSGIGPALAAIAGTVRTAMAEASTALYGGQIKDASTALREALVWTQARGMQ